MEWMLVIYVYAGVWAKGDSVTMTTVPMASEEICNAAGERLPVLVEGTAKEVRFVCLRNQ